MQKIIFVCTGNTCRSPMAEVLGKKIMLEAGLEILIQSRGLAVFEKGSAHQHAINAVKNYGLDLSGHVATQFSSPDCLGKPLILTMTSGHKVQLLSVFPELEGSIFTINEYAHRYGDIPDPYGRSQEVYNQCADELYKIIDLIIKRLQEDIK